MNRRNFIKVIGTGAVILAAAPAAMKLSGPSQPLKLRPQHGYDDIRKTLVSFALLSPNPHNTQAWSVSLEQPDTILLYVDQQRLLPNTDPYHRQIHIGHGAFIESLVIAASHYGIDARVSYFPEGEYSNQELAFKPVAAIRLVTSPDVQADPLFAELTTRQSSKQAYLDESLTPEQLSRIAQVANSGGIEFTSVQDPAGIKSMAAILNQGMEIEEQNHQRSLETIGMFRFSDEEFAKYRDGFGLPQNGVNGVKRWLAESLFVSREKAESDPAAFGQLGVELTRKITASTRHYGWIKSHDNSRRTQLIAGRVYHRINLTTSAMGLAMHPMSQVLQEYQDMLPLQARFKREFGIAESDTVQMLFRLGKAGRLPASPRREVQDILI